MTTDSSLPSALYVVATPIGHLDDITRRAAQILSEVEVCCCEDTRHSRRLLDHLGVRPKLVSVHEHNERERIDFILSLLEQGQRVALVSDAGTPLISDPGFPLVRAVVAAGYDVRPVPGVSAVTAALSVAGLPTDRWVFEGFLPAKPGQRQQRLQQLASESRTLVFYESSHRIERCLEDIVTVLGADRPLCLARELTKQFETVLRGSAGEIREQVATDADQRKGEFVLMVGGATETTDTVQSQLDGEQLMAVLAPLMPPKAAAATLVELIGGRKKDWYERIIALEKPASH
ncbi:16S rRNA (cytidine(1402)-2'-O)-methyltransferase [Saccharospirillum sp. MSK14-1]|uniref:16S rRNA (cytidine(1402)-2'-O)-methyltransferase n=1 Tax=Saccharospirillum sp. MSK14-1 TaxID=1897632 RepID=UPI000D3960FD|nr:16S rRNA (cytidine(1402)-2'-O)-methyltransferase [Saccharospirillum sp. MSK14-1]PTY38984.1 16S rRNA (cytidine(1402)-2'-O)-methyltransferase [Saccharospirillum sp. MSK14-1]